MQARLRLLKGATALLYLGPLLAGIAGYGWRVVPLFLGIFLLWLFILRPQKWPRTWADWSRPEALIALLTQGVVQLLLVVVSLGIGRGIGGVLGVMPEIPLMLPVAVSFLSIPLARMLWDPWRADAGEVVLDEALARLEAEEDPAPADDLKRRIEIAARMVAALDRLPAEAAPELLADHLHAMATQTSHEALRVALMDPIYDGSATAVVRRAAAVHATEPAVFDGLQGSTYPLAVFRALSAGPTLGLFARRCADLVAQRPDRLGDCPDPEDVMALAARVPGAAAELAALAKALTRAKAAVAHAGGGPRALVKGAQP
ncbi:MAG: hypothetical protein ACO22Z_08680 [Paracoccaceae bacterium]